MNLRTALLVYEESFIMKKEHQLGIEKKSIPNINLNNNNVGLDFLLRVTRA